MGSESGTFLPHLPLLQLAFRTSPATSYGMATEGILLAHRLPTTTVHLTMAQARSSPVTLLSLTFAQK